MIKKGDLWLAEGHHDKLIKERENNADPNLADFINTNAFIIQHNNELHKNYEPTVKVNVSDTNNVSSPTQTKIVFTVSRVKHHVIIQH